MQDTRAILVILLGRDSKFGPPVPQQDSGVTCGSYFWFHARLLHQTFLPIMEVVARTFFHCFVPIYNSLQIGVPSVFHRINVVTARTQQGLNPSTRNIIHMPRGTSCSAVAVHGREFNFVAFNIIRVEFFATKIGKHDHALQNVLSEGYGGAFPSNHGSTRWATDQATREHSSFAPHFTLSSRPRGAFQTLLESLDQAERSGSLQSSSSS